MTKQEYENKINNIDHAYDMDGKIIAINEEYIASLEADNATLTLLHSQATDQMLTMQNRIHELEAEVAKLSRALDVLCNKLEQLACPPNANPHDGQPCNDSDDCVNCWREYALAEAEEEKP